MLSTIEEYKELEGNDLSIDEARHLCRTDLYFLLRYIIGRKDLEHPWLLERCKEVQNEPDGHLDLWSREHYKSTIITFAKSIQDILGSHGNDALPDWGNREVTIGIFSHTRPIAKKFLRQIKAELETNQKLIQLFPDVLYSNPKREAPKWSEDAGLLVKRKSNAKEATVEAWGLVDGQPTGAHFLIRVYDDVVTYGSVNTPEMIQKTTVAWELSLNLGMHDGGVERYIGTRYHANDTYRTILQREAAKQRVYAATDDGEFTGNPVYWSNDFLQKRIREMGPFTAAAQLMQNPLADAAKRLDPTWIRYYDRGEDGGLMNKYILVDPANEKKKKSDYTAIAVIGLGQDHNYYLLDLIRDRLNLYERTEALFYLHKRWKPLKVGYEKYSMQADIQHIKYVQGIQNYRFGIVELGGNMAKDDRIHRLVPIFANYRFYIPESIHRTNYEGVTQDLIRIFIEEEYQCWPVPVHEDILDVISRIEDPDLGIMWPKLEEDNPGKDRYARKLEYDRFKSRKRSWRSA